MAKLIVLNDDASVRQEYVLKNGPNRLGRHPAQDVQILDRVVSKEHCIVEFRSPHYFVRDMGSRNGTFVNNSIITQEAKLNEGDELLLGSTIVTFREELEDELSQRVTISPEHLESNIQAKLSQESHVFMPEEQITDADMLRRDYEKLRIAHTLNFAMGMERNLDTLLNKVLEKAFEIFAADRGVLLLWDPVQNKMVPKLARTRDGRTDVDIKISQTIMNTIVEERSAVLSSDAQLDSRFGHAQSIILHGIRSTMSVPMLYEEILLGVVHLDALIASGAFTYKDLQILNVFAIQAAQSIRNAQLIDIIKREALARENLARLLSPNLVEKIVSGELTLEQGGEEREVTVMFADIRGFTAMSEKLPAQDIVEMLNEYFELMVDIIFKHHGTLDKFIGDEIMALWGAPLTQPDDAFEAVATAFEMQTAMKEFNEVRVAEGNHPIYIGIGINTGECISGYMGSTKKVDFTVIGDAVNLASRICGLAKADDLFISEATYAQVKDRVQVEQQSPVKVKGKEQSVIVYRVLNVYDGQTDQYKNTT